MMAPKYEPGWTIPHHGNYCDHYATAIGDDNTCGRCGATRLINGLYTLVDHLPTYSLVAQLPHDAPPGAEYDDDTEALAAELVTEYAAAIERDRDRAQEARIGGALARHAPQFGPRDLAELTRHARREAYYRLSITQADELSPAGPIRWTPIGAAGLAID